LAQMTHMGGASQKGIDQARRGSKKPVCLIYAHGVCRVAHRGAPEEHLQNKRTIPHFPFPPLISKGFPAIKNLGLFRESSGRNFTYKKTVDFGSWWNSIFKCGNCGDCGNCGLIVAFAAFVAIVAIVD
jgi:hypothetical protein